MKRMKEKDGWITILVLCIISVLLPIFLFFYVEMNNYYNFKERLSYVNQNIASSTVRSIDEEALKLNEVVIDEQKANEIAERLLKENYFLDSDFSITPKSGLLKEPILNVYVVNDTGQLFTTPEGFSYQIKHPTVIVYTEIKPKNLFISRFVTLKDVKAYEVQISEEALQKIEENKKKTNIPKEKLIEFLENLLILLPEHVKERIPEGTVEQIINYLTGYTLKITDLEFHILERQQE